MKRWLMAVASMVVLAPASDRPPPPPADPSIHYLYLIRHGSYVRERHQDERVGNGLDSLGRDQARLIAARLAGLPIHIDTLVTSDFTRARETAAIIGQALHRIAAVDTLIHECTPTTDQLRVIPNRYGPERERCDARLRAAWDHYARPATGGDERDVLVCHGNVIRWFVARALGVDPRRWTAMDIGNASLTVIAVRPDGSTRLVLFSDVGHLPAAMQSWTGRAGRWALPADSVAAPAGAGAAPRAERAWP